jgi:hypothetical protein
MLGRPFTSPAIPMKTTRYLLVLTFLALSGHGFAEQMNQNVSKEEAKEFGATLRSVQGEDSVHVWLEFTPKGKLKDFTQVELGIGDPKKRIMAAPLQTTRSPANTVSAHFSTDWAHFPASSLTIVVNEGRLAQYGYVFKVSDFISKEGAEKKETADAKEPVYKTAAEVKAIPACKATVKRINEYSSRFTTADGKEFTVGGDTGEQEVWHFNGLLKDGDTCELPAAFNAFSSRKCYNTAEAIKAIPACKATVKVQAPCYNVFTATDGTVLVIGDPGSDGDVAGFLHSLEKGQTCELPDAFLEFVKKK